MGYKVRAIYCGKKCKKCPHKFYKYYQWWEGAKVREKYLGVCDKDGNTTHSEVKNEQPRTEEKNKKENSPIASR